VRRSPGVELKTNSTASEGFRKEGERLVKRIRRVAKGQSSSAELRNRILFQYKAFAYWGEELPRRGKKRKGGRQ